jgi:hypothetical protein
MRKTRVYVLLGQGGVLFSSGMVALADRIRTLGNTSVSTHTWDDVQAIADSIQALSPEWAVALIGKSLGANSTTLIAAALPKDAIDLIVSYDASRFFSTQLAPIGSNVERTISFWNPYAWPFGGARITGHNVEEHQINRFHITLDSDPDLTNLTLAAVKALSA